MAFSSALYASWLYVLMSGVRYLNGVEVRDWGGMSSVEIWFAYDGSLDVGEVRRTSVLLTILPRTLPMGEE